MVTVPSPYSTALTLPRASRESKSAYAAQFAIASGDGVGNAVIDAFANSPRLEAMFETAYAAGLERSSLNNGSLSTGQSVSANNNVINRSIAHNALVETILSNRSSFPSSSFSINTTLDDGSSITTEIPAAASVTPAKQTYPTVAAGPSAERLSAQSLVASLAVAGAK